MVVRRYFRLLRLYGRMDLQILLRDKRTGFLYVLEDWITALSSISGIALLAVRFGGIGGLSADEVLWMLGFYTLSDGAVHMLMGNYNVLDISRRIGRSQVDHMLMQPIPLWMQLFSEGFMPFTGSSVFFTGVALTVYATLRLDLSLSIAWYGALLVYVLARMAVTAGVAYLSGAAAFYHPVSCEEISSIALDALRTAGKYPLSAMPLWLQALFSTVLPVGLMAWLPAMILLDHADAPVVHIWPVAVSALFLSLAGYAFRRGLARYTRFGCPRYKSMGHRI